MLSPTGIKHRLREKKEAEDMGKIIAVVNQKGGGMIFYRTDFLLFVISSVIIR